MKIRQLIAFVATGALLSSCIIADPYSSGHGRDGRGDYGRPRDDRRDHDDGRYGNDYRRDHDDDRDHDRGRERDDRRN